MTSVHRTSKLLAPPKTGTQSGVCWEEETLVSGNLCDFAPLPWVLHGRAHLAGHILLSSTCLSEMARAQPVVLLPLVQPPPPVKLSPLSLSPTGVKGHLVSQGQSSLTSEGTDISGQQHLPQRGTEASQPGRSTPHTIEGSRRRASRACTAQQPLGVREAQLALAQHLEETMTRDLEVKAGPVKLSGRFLVGSEHSRVKEAS